MQNRAKKVLEVFSNKIKRSYILVDKNGVKKDKFYNQDKKRAILISSTKSYNLAKKNNINLNIGELGENIAVNFDIYKLPVGTRIKIGDTILQISQNCTLCKSLSKIDKKLPKLLKNDRGIFAIAIKKGMIKKNAPIKIIKRS